MLKYIEVTGKTEDEALNKGLQQLGLDRDDVSVEILERGKTGFLGIGSVPARIKLTYEVSEEVKKEEKDTIKVGVNPGNWVSSTPEKEKHHVYEANKKSELSNKQRKKEIEENQRNINDLEKKTTEKEIINSDESDVIEAIRKFQMGLFEHMGEKAEPVITRVGETYEVVLEGEDLGSLIGHHGETLDAIQRLTGYAVNRGRNHRVVIHVDAEGYRARREESLVKLARKSAARAVKYHRSITLEAMNAYERHIIHSALQDYPHITTYSTGTEPNRRTVICYDPNKE